MEDGIGRVLACRMARSRDAWVAGAMAYLIEPPKRVRLKLLVESRSGRWIRVWTNIDETLEFELCRMWFWGHMRDIKTDCSFDLLHTLNTHRLHQEAKKCRK